jgi:hypothetical protein
MADNLSRWFIDEVGRLTDARAKDAVAHRRQVQSLRAKLMRERADAQVCIADLCEIIEYWQRIKAVPKVAVFRARARRLRAEADRIERGGQ